jgi:hypothetical protein
MRSLVIPYMLVFFLSSCSIFPVTTADSGIEGQVFIGPMCPVVVEGQECPDRPYQATISILDQDGRKVLDFQTDAEGNFRVPLAEGEYILHPESPNGIPSAADQPFTVLAGQFTQMTVSYDSGIR